MKKVGTDKTTATDEAAPPSANSPPPMPPPAGPQLATTGGTAQGQPPGKFDPERFRLSQDFVTMGAVKKHLMTVRIRKPTKEEFVIVHPGVDFQMPTYLLELKDTSEIYALDPGVLPELVGEATVTPRVLYTAINRQNAVFLWPVRLFRPDERPDEWNKSAQEAAEMAKKGWIRMVSNRAVGAYDVFTPATPLSPPAWPDVSFATLFQTAFKDRIIDSLDHPVLRQLRGEE